jgi:putative hydroxymethylpyrimidine transporter CytX
MDIRPVPNAMRTLSGRDLFLLWAGVAISLAEILAGGFLAPLGLQRGLWAIVLGHLIGNTLMALAGVIGSDHGLMAMVSVRPAFGIRGSNLAAVLNIVQLVGWAAIMLVIGGRAGAALGRPLGGLLASEAVWVAAIGIGTLAWAQWTGRAAWKLLQNVSVLALLLVVAAMTWVAFGALPGPPKAAAEPLGFMTALDLVIAMPISWMPLVSDYSRLARRPRSAFWAAWWGYFLLSSWMYALGLQATIVTGASDPGQLILETMGAVGLAVPALFMVVFSTITSDFPDVYSAACSLLNISRRLSARTVMWLVGALSILLALVFPMEQYESFLFLIGAMFIPLFGVVLTDYFILRRRRLDTAGLYADGGGPYWYRRGYHPAALAAWGLGFAVYEAMALLQAPVGGSIPCMLAAGLIYAVLARRGAVRS